MKNCTVPIATDSLDQTVFAKQKAPADVDVHVDTVPAPLTPRCFKDEFGDSLDNLLVHVSPASRTVLALHYIEDQTLPEISDILDIPLGTVKSRPARGISLLRNIAFLNDPRDKKG